MNIMITLTAFTLLALSSTQAASIKLQTREYVEPITEFEKISQIFSESKMPTSEDLLGKWHCLRSYEDDNTEFSNATLEEDFKRKYFIKYDFSKTYFPSILANLNGGEISKAFASDKKTKSWISISSTYDPSGSIYGRISVRLSKDGNLVTEYAVRGDAISSLTFSSILFKDMKVFEYDYCKKN